MTDIVDMALFAQAAASKQILLEGDTPEKTVELAGNAAACLSGVTLRVLEATDTRVACREGCSYCCHIAVEVHAPEALERRHDYRRVVNRPEWGEIRLFHSNLERISLEDRPLLRRHQVRTGLG
jgi:hypothetical protein